MSRTRRLDNLRADLRWQADQLGATALLRHDNTAVNRIINQSIQRFREWVSEEGYAMYLTPANFTLPVGATSPYAWGVFNPPLVYQRIFGVDVTVDGEIKQLREVPFTERNQFQGPDGPQSGIPTAYFVYGQALQTTQVLGILPPSDAAYAGVIWYLPTLADLSSDSSEFEGIAGWEEWVVWDGLLKVVVRDKYPQQYQVAVDERARLQGEILQRIRQNRPTAQKRRDVRSQRAMRFNRDWIYR